MQEWYVVDRSTGKVVNCIMTAKLLPDNPDPKKYYLTDSPTQVQLESYRYYRERP